MSVLSGICFDGHSALPYLSYVLQIQDIPLALDFRLQYLPHFPQNTLPEKDIRTMMSDSTRCIWTQQCKRQESVCSAVD